MHRSTRLAFLPALVSLLCMSSGAYSQAPKRARESEPVIVPNEKAMAAKRALLDQISPAKAIGRRPPNIVLILADDLGYADIGAYGSKTIPTPHIDALARSGTRFTDAYVTAATCSPSRAGLVTGRYQQRFGFEFNTSGGAMTHRESRGLLPSAVTLAEILKQAGYATGMFGKWHLGTRQYFHPQQRGFDEFYGFLAGAHSFFPAKGPEPVYRTIMRGNKALTEPEYLTDAIARETAKFIGSNKDRSFFAYVPFNAVHTPIEASPKYQKRFSDEKRPKQRDYNAMTSALDDAVGTIMEAVRENGQVKNTLVIFLNDNGGPIYTGVQSNGPLRLGKLFLFEGGIRVPMIISWPGVIKPERVCRGVTSSMDIFPTACTAAGLKLPEALQLDGVNLLPYLTDKTEGAPHQFLFWSNGPNKAVRHGKWKLVKAGDHNWLFDLSKDIGEKSNLAKEHPDTVEKLEKALKKWQSEMSPPAWPSKPNRRKTMIDGVPYELNI